MNAAVRNHGTAGLLMAIGRVVEVSIMVCGKLPACVTHDMKKTRHLCHQEDRAFSDLVGLPTPLVLLLTQPTREKVLGLATPAPAPAQRVCAVALTCKGR